MGVEENSSGTVTTDVADVTGTTVTATAEAVVAEEVTTLAAGTVVYPIAPGYRVNVRRGPGTQYGIVRTLPYGMSVPVYCQKPGERVTGPYGTSNVWDNIANGQFVADAYVHTGSDGYIAPRCD
ncbi:MULTISPECIES: SH3 domain-containing protein [Streptomyces]|uniref:SH3 domain-containing protein n=1 Tax=Streptomyces silvae TaxID=2803812 RepID=A0ABU8A3L9_9ACTN|nr:MULTISPECIES: SH3 domain-containing protein [unclassified Streptomyces]WSS69637.1 SH3 domain-containing protein [Streptomyces sp. NBC_01175]WSS76653.1 SH3 domain-containing protein [Streptomyces sp. NBC_01174]MDX3329137.1 SH3 domain-containing protein [Streptomyces sp. ME02-6979-3A]MDX3433963.1 SH3 domain-containing protein [Streptomyces sp. ME01-18a]MDX3687043.1 SH3 domain-containing protein [Streptomyces sp. AK04-4c]